jgi:hypothetical protein
MSKVDIEAQRIVSFLKLIEENIDHVVKVYDKIAPEWLVNLKFQDGWSNVRSMFPDELLVKQRILNYPDVSRNMELHGLSGPALDAKIAFLKEGAERFRSLAEKQSGNHATVRNGSSWLLMVIDNYLESLMSIFPALVSAKEFNRQIGTALQTPQDLDQKTG